MSRRSRTERPSPRGGELDPLIDTYQHEAHRPRANEALRTLQKIASMVKPIMRQRGWRVGTLAEFYPEQRNLLGININQNQKICLRLRHAGDENQFMPIEDVTDTMLHELCHFVHGPHNQDFHALWDQLRDEYETLVRKGYTGEGFLSDGRRLGGQRLPMHEAKRRARAAAEKRRQLQGGHQRLGGRPVQRGEDIRKIIADAAQRRINIEKGCASGTAQGTQIAESEKIKKEGVDVTTTQAEYDDPDDAITMQAFIDLIQEEELEKYGNAYIPPSQANPAGMRTGPAGLISNVGLRSGPEGLTLNGTGRQKSLIEQQMEIERRVKQEPSIPDTQPPPSIKQEASNPDVPPRPSSIKQETKPIPTPNNPARDTSPDTWTCEICTLVNPLQYLVCGACETERPPRAPKKQTTPTPSALQPRLSVADSLAKLQQQEAAKPPKPLGWVCVCGNFMAQEWWTCARCGRMKEAS